MNNLLYDDKNIKSIVEYAQKLENKTIEQVNSEQKSFAGKVEKNKTNKIVQNNNNKGKNYFPSLLPISQNNYIKKLLYLL